MNFLSYNCPICGRDIVMYDNGEPQQNDIIKITTKRRSVVLVHRECYNSQTRKGEK